MPFPIRDTKCCTGVQALQVYIEGGIFTPSSFNTGLVILRLLQTYQVRNISCESVALVEDLVIPPRYWDRLLRSTTKRALIFPECFQQKTVSNTNTAAWIFEMTDAPDCTELGGVSGSKEQRYPRCDDAVQRLV